MLLRFCLVPQNLRKQPLRGEMKRERRVVDDHHWALGTDHWHRDQGVVFSIHTLLSLARCLPARGWTERAVRQVLRNWLALPRIFVRCTRIIIHLPWLLPASASATYSIAASWNRRIGRHYLSCGRPYHCRLAAMLPATDNTTATTTLEYTTPKYPIRSDTEY
jgi:hypothetical protein